MDHVEFPEVDGGDSSGEAIYEQPAAARPLPSRSGIVGEAVVHAKHTADCKQPFGDLVSRTGDQLECTSAAKAAFFNARFIAAQ